MIYFSHKKPFKKYGMNKKVSARVRNNVNYKIAMLPKHKMIYVSLYHYKINVFILFPEFPDFNKVS